MSKKLGKSKIISRLFGLENGKYAADVDFLPTSNSIFSNQIEIFQNFKLNNTLPETIWLLLCQKNWEKAIY